MYQDERVLKDNTKVDVSEYGNIENEVIDKTNDLQKW